MRRLALPYEVAVLRRCLRVPSSPPIEGSPSGDQERGDAEVHPDECRACSRFAWWMPESQS